jgi:hypothetical protein
MSDPKVLERRRQTFQKKYGVDNPLQNADVLKKRQQTCLERYGVSSISQVPEINKRQREGFRKKYGVDHFMKNPNSMIKFRNTMIEKYGVPSLAFVSRRSSSEAQIFFQKIWDMLPISFQEKCYFSPHSHEFNVFKNAEYFKYDFVKSDIKKCIEYNGHRFHPQPGQLDDEIGWCLFRPKLTVKEARQYETRKLGALLDRGFQILVIWDYEVKHDYDSIIQLCLEFLQGIRPGNWPNPIL